MKKLLLYLFILCIPLAFASISLPAIFGDRMVMQQNAEITLQACGDLWKKCM